MIAGHFFQQELESVFIEVEREKKVESETEEKSDEYFQSEQPSAVHIWPVQYLKIRQTFYRSPTLPGFDIPPEL